MTKVMIHSLMSKSFSISDSHELNDVASSGTEAGLRLDHVM
jgi:hypothetical protein